MRMLAKVTIPVERGNDALKSGALPRTMQSAMDKLQPEAAYFFWEDGMRACLFVFDLEGPSRLPSLLEPLFQNLDASVHVTPVMNGAEFEQGLRDADDEQRKLAHESEFLADIAPLPAELQAD